jgi:magnesium-transporting ATPase (P-type)
MTFTVKKITDIVVGDFVLVQNKEIIPADLVLLAVDSLESACFVDVSGIIGGQNLIKKVPVKETQSFISQDGYDAVNLFRHIEDVKVSQPNSSFMKFSGKIKMKGNPKAIKIGIDNLLLREAQMTGSSWAVGLVVYTGMETKFWINSKKEDIFKSSKMSKTINLTLSTFLSIYLILPLSSSV